MPNKNYLKGYRFERQVKEEWEKKGFHVFRQGKSAFPDLICIRNNNGKEIVLIECKADGGRGYLTPDERERAKDLINEGFTFYTAIKYPDPKDKRRKLIKYDKSLG